MASSTPRPSSETNLLDCIDSAALRPRYWGAFSAIVLLLICELFDFFVVGYLVSAIAPAWQLTFGQTTIMLLSAGVGAMVGALVCGWIADRSGRKRTLLASAVLVCLGAGSIAFVPDGAWELFALLRFLVGFGYGGAGSTQFALIAEYTPLRYRTLLTSSLGIPAGVGLLLASVVVTNLFPVLGWRGTAALGFLPLLLVVVIARVAPESPRWLIAAGQPDKAKAAAASMLQIPTDVTVALAAKSLPSGSLPEVFAERRRFWLIVLIQIALGTVLSGVLLWGPTILAQLMRISPREAAHYFIGVSLSALLGRIAFTWLPHAIGRVRSGLLVGYCGAVLLALAAVFHSALWLGLPAFLLCVMAGEFFFDGGYSNLTTYAAELYPVRLGALAMGVSAASAGVGKIVGPLALGLISGTSNLVTPAVTERAVQPAFLFLAGCCLLVGLSYSVLGIETSPTYTRGK